MPPRQRCRSWANMPVLRQPHQVPPRSGGPAVAAATARASWNYRLPSCDARPDKVLVSYDLTRLQRLNTGRRRPLHRQPRRIRADRTGAVLQDLVYEHPQYTPESMAAQQRILGELGDDRLAFAGAYHGWGFHEDGAASGVRAAAQLGRDWEDPFAFAADTTATASRPPTPGRPRSSCHDARPSTAPASAMCGRIR